ncbi:MAG: hypothetical protein HY719_08910 [Planctomycetes bacterium]|nr:hypothetical protein [Planctomycetota bacterium]
MPRFVFTLVIIISSLVACALRAGEADALALVSRLPVREVTVFKDGHAFVLHEGALPVEADGTVVIDNLPAPVIGTFWPYVAEGSGKLKSVTAGRRLVRVVRTALTLRELVEANTGAEVVVRDAGLRDSGEYRATIIGFLERGIAEVAASTPDGAEAPQPQKSNLLQLKTTEGTRIVPFEALVTLRFLGKYTSRVVEDVPRHVLTLRIDWGDEPPAKEAVVGITYLQKGIRWIPGYRVELDGNGKAVAKLQATLLNELTDVKDAAVNLVVGVPSFTFQDTLDPMAQSRFLQQTAAGLSQYFQTDSRTAYGMSNGLMTQVPMMLQQSRAGEHYRPSPAPAPPPAEEPDLGPEVDTSAKNDDLFVFVVSGVTLKKGERMVLPVSRTTIAYQDVYTLDLPYAPPTEFRKTTPGAQAQELARMLNAPKVMHKVRLTNPAANAQPLTTAPALILKENRVLAQAMMTYTAPGARSDLTITAAVNVKIAKSETEVERQPNAAKWNSVALQRVDLEGRVSLTNLSRREALVEVTRYVLGNVDSATDGGAVESVNLSEDEVYFQPVEFPSWWRWYGWPRWWSEFNGVGKITWRATLPVGESIDLRYKWHYFWG